jgi:serine/threonine-protein kinase SRK2
LQIRELGEGQFGVAKMAHDRLTGEIVAIKFIKRGNMVSGTFSLARFALSPSRPSPLILHPFSLSQEHKTLEREILNHRSLLHPNVIRFHEVFLTKQFLAIVMEFAAGGELYGRVVARGRFEEPEARYFFQQLVCGLDYCHRKVLFMQGSSPDLLLFRCQTSSAATATAVRWVCNIGMILPREGRCAHT